MDLGIPHDSLHLAESGAPLAVNASDLSTQEYSHQWNFVPQDDMTPLEAIYIVWAVRDAGFGYPLEQSGWWEKIQRHFQEAK